MIVPIPNRPGYFACDKGHVYSTRLNRWRARPEPRRLTEAVDKHGYQFVRICVEGFAAVQPRRVSVLVCEAFYGAKPFPDAQVRHLNGNKLDNRPSNLAWGTPKENAADRERHGNTLRGERHGMARHTTAEVHAAIARVRAGEPRRQVASDLGIHPRTLSMWVVGKGRADAAALEVAS